MVCLLAHEWNAHLGRCNVFDQQDISTPVEMKSNMYMDTWRILCACMIASCYVVLNARVHLNVSLANKDKILR